MSANPNQVEAAGARKPTGARHSLMSRAADPLYPLAAATMIILSWHYAIRIFEVPHYIVPSPSAVVAALYEERALLFANLLPTAIEALSGFVAGNTVGVLLAVAFVYSRPLSKAFFPIIICIKTIPIVAIAPMLLIAFGFGYTPKIIVAALISFFPTLVNVMRGLRTADPQLIELFRVLSATTLEVFLRVRMYAALPYLFAALKVAAPASVIGAMVSEWIGSRQGLGYLIVQATTDFRTALLYATIAVTATLALTLMGIVAILERMVVRWQPGDQL